MATDRPVVRPCDRAVYEKDGGRMKKRNFRWDNRKVQPKKYHDAQINDVGEDALAAAIVMQAVWDYRQAKRYLNGDLHMKRSTWINKFGTSPETIILEVVGFLHSKWYGVLCDIPAERIIEKLWSENTAA